MTKTERIKYLIIGNSAGGVGAAEAIREVDKIGTITIVSDEPHPAYSRPLISEYLSERRPLERMLFRMPDFYQEHGIRAVLGQKVMKINIGKRDVRLEDGGKIAWEKLLLATGGSPVIPRTDGIGLKGVFTFTTLDDARAIDQFLNQYHRRVRAIVIGGGLIGVAAAEALVKRGAEVTIIEMKERILNTILDEEASALMEKTLAGAAVEIIAGHTVSKISSYWPGEASGVILDDGRQIPCDMVIFAIGVQPRTELVSDTGIKVNRGILVDRRMATTSPDVYACGDVAEAYEFVYNDNRLTPVWPNAYIGGRIAGLNMAGAPAEYQGGTAMNTMTYFGLNIVSAGMVVPPDNSYEIVSEKHGYIYRKVVLKEGRIAGLVFTGDIEKSGIIYSLMKDRTDVEAFKQALVADDFGLASLPAEIWRPLLDIPPSLLASPVSSVGHPEEALVGE